jgi:hypothetical protein
MENKLLNLYNALMLILGVFLGGCGFMHTHPLTTDDSLSDSDSEVNEHLTTKIEKLTKGQAEIIHNNNCIKEAEDACKKLGLNNKYLQAEIAENRAGVARALQEIYQDASDKQCYSATCKTCKTSIKITNKKFYEVLAKHNLRGAQNYATRHNFFAALGRACVEVVGIADEFPPVVLHPGFPLLIPLGAVMHSIVGWKEFLGFTFNQCLDCMSKQDIQELSKTIKDNIDEIARLEAKVVKEFKEKITKYEQEVVEGKKDVKIITKQIRRKQDLKREREQAKEKQRQAEAKLEQAKAEREKQRQTMLNLAQAMRNKGMSEEEVSALLGSAVPKP